MKKITTTLLAALMLLAISCKKESSAIQSSSTTDESSAQAVTTDVNEPATYASIKMGKVVGMVKNLSVSHYRNGELIPQVKDPAKWAALTTGAWCWYNNDSATGHIYGKLYNWYAVNDPRGLAPAGWHIPSESEWTALSKLLGGDAVAGGKMKTTGTIEAGTGYGMLPTPTPPTPVASQGFRAASVITMVHSTTLATSVAGGVLRSMVRSVPGIAACTTPLATSAGTAAVSFMAFLSVASGINYLSI